MFMKEYSLDLVISAVVTLAVILLLIRIYLALINRKSSIRKPPWVDDDRFKDRG